MWPINYARNGVRAVGMHPGKIQPRMGVADRATKINSTVMPQILKHLNDVGKTPFGSVTNDIAAMAEAAQVAFSWLGSRFEKKAGGGGIEDLIAAGGLGGGGGIQR
jgi:hypothetical protein